MYSQEILREQLNGLSDKTYRDFTSSLSTASSRRINGIRIPLLRDLAKKYAKSDDWQSALERPVDISDSFEEILFRGFLIGYAPMTLEESLRRIADYVPLIDDWSLCDSPCSSFRIARREPQKVWDFLQSYLASSDEFSLRFGVVMLLDYYINKEYVGRVLSLLDSLRTDAYYAQMAIAWAISVCFVKFPEETLPVLERSALPNPIYNKALQKILESYRTPENYRSLIRSMKRK